MAARCFAAREGKDDYVMGEIAHFLFGYHAYSHTIDKLGYWIVAFCIVGALSLAAEFVHSDE